MEIATWDEAEKKYEMRKSIIAKVSRLQYFGMNKIYIASSQ